MKVIILGGTGMLGLALVRVLGGSERLVVSATHRRASQDGAGIEWRRFDAASCSDDDIRRVIADAAVVVNAIGVIKPYIDDRDSAKVQRALAINGVFPHRLAQAAAASGARVLQIATDCVFSGVTGGYTEDSAHDALDAYGKTKSLGEVHAPRFHNLRVSIIGPEAGRRTSLLEWVLGQPKDARLKGFVNHLWNGVTTYHFARLCLGAIESELTLPPVLHVLPGDTVTKADLVEQCASAWDRRDLTIDRCDAPQVVNRTLATTQPAVNERLWQAAGFAAPPSIRDMVREQAGWWRTVCEASVG